MLKLGVWRLDQHPASGYTPFAWLRRNCVDYRLLRAAQPPSPAAIAVFEEITRHLRLNSGVFRTTSPDRFRELDARLAPIIAGHFSREAPLKVSDWAVSDAITSVAWHNQLIGAFPNLRFTASDLHLYLLEMGLPDGVSFVLESSGSALQYIQPPWVIRLSQPEPLWLPVNRALARRARRLLARVNATYKLDYAGLEFPHGVDTIEKGPLRLAQIPLLHPTSLALSHSASSFRIVQHSIFDPWKEPADVVRTMNILNPSYFNASQLEQGARNVWHSLVPGGLWIVGRTLDGESGQHRLSVLRKSLDRFEVESRFHEKSEIEDLALAIRP